MRRSRAIIGGVVVVTAFVWVSLAPHRRDLPEDAVAKRDPSAATIVYRDPSTGALTQTPPRGVTPDNAPAVPGNRPRSVAHRLPGGGVIAEVGINHGARVVATLNDAGEIEIHCTGVTDADTTAEAHHE